VRRSLLCVTASVSAIIALGAAALAAPKPMVLSAVYDDSVSSDLKLPKNIGFCTLQVANLTDDRRSPEMIGVYFGRAIHAPNDREAWLRSMVQSLKSRKISIEFTDNTAIATKTRPLEVALTKAWIANTESNISANIVFRVRTADAAGVPNEQFYRGGASHMSYWSGGPGELQRAFDTAVSRALDAAAVDMHKLCSAAG
jgi:hypothetical protein